MADGHDLIMRGLSGFAQAFEAADRKKYRRSRDAKLDKERQADRESRKTQMQFSNRLNLGKSAREAKDKGYDINTMVKNTNLQESIGAPPLGGIHKTPDQIAEDERKQGVAERLDATKQEAAETAQKKAHSSIIASIVKTAKETGMPIHAAIKMHNMEGKLNSTAIERDWGSYLGDARQEEQVKKMEKWIETGVGAGTLTPEEMDSWTKNEETKNYLTDYYAREVKKAEMANEDREMKRQSIANQGRRFDLSERRHEERMTVAERRHNERMGISKQRIAQRKESLDFRRKEEQEDEYVPGLGMAQTKDDAKKLKDSVIQKEKFDRHIGELIDLREKYGVEYINREAVARGKQLSKDLLLTYKNLAKLGVLSQADEAIINAIIPSDPLGQDFVPGQDPTLHKLKKFRGDINAEYKTTLATRLQTPLDGRSTNNQLVGQKAGVDEKTFGKIKSYVEGLTPEQKRKRTEELLRKAGK